MPPRPSKADLTGHLTVIARKRITKEKQRIEHERKELEEFGIYTSWGDELHRSIALIVGPEGTPYAHGFYFFDVAIPNDYPMQPPHVDFKTGDGRVRFNPNLYTEGKVCLSILGTWPGPSWTTSCSLRTVLISIQSLLNEHPFQNEPGHENETGKDDRVYSEIIRYENIAVGVVRMLKQTPAKFDVFRPHMRRLFLKHFDSYKTTLQSYSKKEGTSARSPIWGFNVRYKPIEVLAELHRLQEQLLAEEATWEPNPTEPLSSCGRVADDISAKRQVVAEEGEEAAEAGAPSEKRPRVGPEGSTSLAGVGLVDS